MTAIRIAFQAGALALVLAVGAPSAVAQNLPFNVPSSLLDQLNRGEGGSNTPYDPNVFSPSPLDQVRPRQEQFERLPQRRPLERSPLELDYSRRVGIPLTQFGYDTFRTMTPSSGQLQNGAVADNYRLSIGDELVITLRGQVSRSIRTRVDREGRVVIPDLAPIPAAGRTFGELRQDLDRAVAASFLNTSVSVSVGAIRQISVAVLGEAMAPGLYRMGGFASVLDALALAGGIKKTGSMRHITILRGGQRIPLDLYAVIDGGTPPDLSLGDGDRIIIPTLGPTVAVAGEVDRPGIYELLSGETISGQQALNFAGSALRPTGNRFVRMALDGRGQDRTTEAERVTQLALHAGDILLVLRRDSGAVGSVRLDGHVAVPGIRALSEVPDIRSLVTSTTFLSDPYLLFGVLSTTDDKTHARRLLPIDLDAIVNGRQNQRLKDGDIVIVLSLGDINYLGSADVQAVLQNLPPPLLRQQIVTGNPRASGEAAAPERYQGAFAGANRGPTSQFPGGQYGQNGEFVPNGQGGQQNLVPGQPSNQFYNGQPSIPDQNFPLPLSQSPEGQFAPGTSPSFNPEQQAPEPGVEVPLAGELSPQAGGASPLSGQFAGGQVPLAGQTGANPIQRQFASDLAAQRRTQICRGLQQLASIVAASAKGRFANARFGDVVLTGYPAIENEFACPRIFEKYPELLPLAVDHAAVIEGEVSNPGLYPLVTGASLASAVAEAGGLAGNVDLRRVEITHYAVGATPGHADGTRDLLQLNQADLAKVALGPGDVVRFNPVFINRDNGPVLLTGEFRRPGFFDIRRGERLSELIVRAGGLTDQAYPYGAVFTRQRVRVQEREAYNRAANQIQSGLYGALSRTATTDPQQSQALLAAASQIATQLRATPALGRVVVEADPTVLQVKPQVDPIMEPGDSVFVPKRPFYVAVSGEVLNPTSLQFRAGATPADYIAQAGGYTQDAESGLTFVVLPNGQAQPVKVSFWNFTPVLVPPGSTIVVPKNLRPFDLTTFLRDSTQILSQLAISAASLAVLQNNSTR